MEKELKVGISDYKIGEAPQSLFTIGLGSCVGIAIYDPTTRVGGLSHIMLPDSSMFNGEKKIEKFADLAIPHMVSELAKKTPKRRLVAKIAGGSSMFKNSLNTPQANIGLRNVAAVETILKQQGIPILANHTGGSMGRSMFFDLHTLQVKVRMGNREIFEL